MNNSTHKNKTTGEQSRSPISQLRSVYEWRSLAALLARRDSRDFNRSERAVPNISAPVVLDDDNLPCFPEAQEPMRKACEAIRANIQCDDLFKHKEFRLDTEIDFLHYVQRHGGGAYYLTDTLVHFRGALDEKVISCDFMECYRMNVRVILGQYEGSTRAFVEAERVNGEYLIAELSEFCSLSTFSADGNNFNIVTLFNKSLGVADLQVFDDRTQDIYPVRTDIPAGTKLPRVRGDSICIDVGTY